MNFIIKQNEVSSVLNKNSSSFIKNEPLFINQIKSSSKAYILNVFIVNFSLQQY
ncbi:hypothetical protein [Acinetobacter pittii]|uniref:hypothetical protein n=1 Tax=Acinetobacter pittii TaxID=48296 RepID=UPI000D36FAE5|nr:hypothetical protein [Acinetobacter pittii]PTV47098.1 hypothetical protein DBL01_15095 [Acinetobacter pittii]RSO00970.1 hypothetical protein EA767_00795 [Acinetobacter pittii]WHA54644.1 hypothetical protein OH685_15385 [Acinetobacter pittii]